jgi:hypothetical protein
MYGVRYLFRWILSTQSVPRKTWQNITGGSAEGCSAVLLVRTPWRSVSKPAILTDLPPLVGELSANCCWQRGVAWSAQRIPTAIDLGFLDRTVSWLQSSSACSRLWDAAPCSHVPFYSYAATNACFWPGLYSTPLIGVTFGCSHVLILCYCSLKVTRWPIQYHNNISRTVWPKKDTTLSKEALSTGMTLGAWQRPATGLQQGTLTVVVLCTHGTLPVAYS